jgi:signal peptidase I
MTYDSRRGKRRRPWLAAVFSLLQPGLGHAYAGRLRRAIAMVAVLNLAAFAMVFLLPTMRPSASVLALFLLVVAALYLGVAVDALFVARAAPERYFLERSNSWYVYAATLTLGIALRQLHERVRRIEPFRMPSTSMAPTILLGDWVYVDKRASTRRAIVRTALITYRSPDDSSVALKRVVGLAGDTLLMRNDSLIRNGKAVEESYATVDPSPTSDDLLNRMRNWGPVIVSGDSIFVLGDNRGASKDSRHIGLIPIANVLGKPWMIYYSYDPEGVALVPAFTAVRWTRIGMSPH